MISNEALMKGFHDALERMSHGDISGFLSEEELKDVTIETQNENQVHLVKKLIDAYTKAWSEGHPLVSDEEYDQLVETYIAMSGKGEEARPFTRNKQSSAVNDVVGTLSKVYGVLEPMRPGQKTYSEWVDRHLNTGISNNQAVCVQPKLDGISIAYDADTDRFFTRGDYDNGESLDVTDVCKTMMMANKFKDKDIASVKFEAVMGDDIFESFGYSKKYVNPRAAAAAAIMSRDKNCYLIDLWPLRVYYKDGRMEIAKWFRKYCRVVSIDACRHIQDFIDELLQNGAEVEYETFWEPYPFKYDCDGVVVSILKDDTSYELMQPFDEIAIKILNNIKETKIKSIEWQMGKTGKITPVGILEPVTFENGVTVDHVGLSTFERVHDLKLHFNDTVQIVHNIVPYLLTTKRDGDMIIPMPTDCPICGHPLDMHNLKTIRCTNPECRNKKLGDIVRYCENMKMMGISKGILTKLYDMGYVKSIPDLYKFDAYALSLEKGFAETSVKALKTSIQKASTDVPLERWFGALPCLNVSQKTWKTIIDTLTKMDKDLLPELILCLNTKDCDRFLTLLVQPIYGIGDLTWRAIVEGFRTNWNDICETACCVKVVINAKGNKASKGKVCLSGTRDKMVIQSLEEAGYEVTDHLSADCCCLIIPDRNFTSSKVKKALKANMNILTIEGTLDMLAKIGQVTLGDTVLRQTNGVPSEPFTIVEF